MSRSYQFAVVALVALCVSAQEPPAPPPAPVVYRNTGDAIALDTVCADAEMQEHGLVCSLDEPCPVYLELDSVAGFASHIVAVGNLHTGRETLWSVLLWSADDGQSWTEAYARQRNTLLYLAQCADANSCAAAAHTVGSGLPRDPRVVRTTDAGKTWRATALLEDGAVGSVDALQFTSPTFAQLVLNRGRAGAGRFATMQSADAGDTWSMIASSETRPPRAATAPAALRVAAERSGKTLRIERREGTTWRTLTRFAVEVGACRPAANNAVAPAREGPLTRIASALAVPSSSLH